MSRITKGPKFHPRIGSSHARRIGTFRGLLSQQSELFQDAITSLRGNLDQQAGAQIPLSVELVMSDGTTIRGNVQGEATSIALDTDNVRMLLCQWDGSRFTWGILDIDGDSLSVVVHRNPPEKGHKWRTPAPMIIPPITATK